MLFNIGDFVTRNSYNNDVVFKIINIDNNVAILQGMNIRLCADSSLADLKKAESLINDDEEMFERFDDNELNRADFFYLPGKVVQLDGCYCLKILNKTLILQGF